MKKIIDFFVDLVCIWLQWMIIEDQKIAARKARREFDRCQLKF